MAKQLPNIAKLISLSDELICLANEAIDECRDDGCLSLFGLAKDCGDKLRTGAEQEHRLHEVRDRATVKSNRMRDERAMI